MRSTLINNPIQLAIHDNDIDALKSLIDSGIDINAAWLNKTPLSFAVEMERPAMVRLLLAAGADMYATVSAWGFLFDEVLPVCLLAPRCPNEDVVAAFIEAGVNLSRIPNCSDRTTLCHSAAYNSNEKVLARLLAAGASHSLRDRRGQFPSHLAAGNANAAVITLLLDAGADCWSGDLRGSTPAHVSAASGTDDVMLQLIIANVPFDEFDSTFATPCSVAVVGGHGPVLRRLIAAGCDLRRPTGKNKSPICSVAARFKDESMLTILLEAGAELNATNIRGETPLFAAAANSNENVISTLINAGAKATILESGQTLLHAAAMNPNEKVLKHVIAMGLDLNARAAMGMTASHWAAMYGSPGGLRVLAEAGACNACDDRHRNVCHCAALNECAEVLELAISLGFDINGTDSEGNSPCHTAARNGRPQNLLTLVNAGANVNAVNSNGESVLHCVASMWNYDGLQRQALRLMLERGANFRAIDSNGRSPLFGATPAATAIFFARGIDIDATDNRNRSACDRAATTRSASALAMLIAAGASVDTDTLNNDRVRWEVGDFEESHLALLQVAGVRDMCVSDKALAKAEKIVHNCQLELLKLRAFELCIGLQSLELPALVTCEIVAKSFGRRELLLKFHLLWTIVTLVKHFRK